MQTSSSEPERRLNEGPPSLIDTTADTVFAAFEHTARHHPSHEFLHVPRSAARRYATDEVTLTYDAAFGQVTLLSEAYWRAGLGRGRRVATLLENRPAAFLHWLALNRLGVSVVPINPDYRPAEIRHLLEHSEACLVIAIPDRVAEVRAAASTLERPPPVIEASAVGHGIEPLGPEAPPLVLGRADECALLYTSGTTGRPKGCVLSNDYYIRLGLRYLNRKGCISLQPGRERVLTPLPMFHMNAMATTTLAMILSAGCVIQLDRFHPETWWHDVRTTRATGIHYLGVMPAILLGLPPSADERAHQVRYGSGANVEPKHHAAFEARFGFPLVEAWAMTETGSAIGLGAEEEPRHVGTRCFGRVPPTVELRLVDDEGADVPAGEPGEMLVRRAGPEPRLGFFSGYLKDPQATEEGWSDGWWHTGDLARFGPGGSLHFVDRKKNVIRRSGENISALEVEQLLRGCPGVRDAAVSGTPDEIRGEEVVACIVPASPTTADELAARRIVAWMLQQAAYYKAPGWVTFVDALPTTPTQKIDRAGLKRFVAERVGGNASFDTRAMKRRDARPAA
jgi:acyl-CoA synthetase (AMP-forming)/AMP-acid ligase II